MTFGEIKAMNIPDDTEIMINSVWNKDTEDLDPIDCDGYYNKKDNKLYLTPSIISI